MVKYLALGLVILFSLILLGFLFRIWWEGRRERIAPRDIPSETLPAELRENALRPLS